MKFISPRHFFDHKGVFLAAIFLAWSICGLGTWANLAQIRNVSNTKLAGAPLPEIDPESPTGYALGQRRLILKDADSCQWIMHAQRMWHAKTWRERWMPKDNAPVGREIHWSQSISWWLIAMGMVTSWVTGLPVAAGIEVAAPWAGIVILGISMVVVPFCIRRTYGWLAAALGAIAMATVFPFANLFMAGCIDHHGLIALAGSVCLLGLSAGGGGWIGGAPAEEKRARRWFIASGLAAAVTLWLSAASAIPYFAGMGLVLLILAGFIPKNDAAGLLRYQPNLWRLWGLTGSLGSLFFYLLEYFPHHLGWRLEVNHPLYAIALLSGGECFHRLIRWRTTGENPFADWRGSLSLLLALVGLLLIPAVISIAKQQVFLVGDPFLWRLHNDYIEEFKPLLELVRNQDWPIRLLIIGPLPLLVFAVAKVLLDRQIDLATRTTVALPFGAALLTTALGFWQFRWYNIANGPWIVVLIVLAGYASQLPSRRRFTGWEKIGATLFLGMLLGYLPWINLLNAREFYRNPQVLQLDDGRSVVVRDVAYRLRRSAQSGEIPVVASSPTVTTQLIYFGGIHGLGTLYWENTEGLKSAAELYSAGDAKEALRLVQRHHVSHIAIFAGENLVFGYPRLWRGLPNDSSPQDTFAYHLVIGRDLPSWVRRIPYSASGSIRKKGVWAMVYDVKNAGMEP